MGSFGAYFHTQHGIYRGKNTQKKASDAVRLFLNLAPLNQVTQPSESAILGVEYHYVKSPGATVYCTF